MGEPTTLAVHRCRFVDHNPSAVTAIAFPPLPLPSPKGKKPTTVNPQKFGCLVIGHGNGNIDICEWTSANGQIISPQAWVVRQTLVGPYPSKIDALALTLRYSRVIPQSETPNVSDLRLFSSGGGDELVEWNLESGTVKRKLKSQGGTIWSMSANPSSTLLALGCEDGSVRLVSLLHGSLEHTRKFDKIKCKILSIAWGPPAPRETKQTAARDISDESSDDEDEEEDWKDTWLVTGGSDSGLRKWNIVNGRVVDRMGVDKTKGERTLVWTVGVLGDGTIISGDSLGTVKFWDSRTCTQLQSFQGHGADVLCLAISPEGRTVYTSGVDQKITQFTLITTSDPSSAKMTTSRWILSCSRRLHSHDVRALSIFPPYTPLPPTHSHLRTFPIDVAPILASGGLDMLVALTPSALTQNSNRAKVVNPLKTSWYGTFENSYHRRLAYATAPSGVRGISVARQARLVTCMREAGVSVWRILKKPTPPLSEHHGAQEMEELKDEENVGRDWEKVLEIELNVQTNLIASGISDDGRWLVCSDLFEARLFRLEITNKAELQPRRVRDFAHILGTHLPKGPTSSGARAVCFSPDCSKLVLTTAVDAHVIVVDLSDENKPRVIRRFDHHRQQTSALRGRTTIRKGRRVNGDQDVKMKESDSISSEDEENPSGNESEDDTPVVANILRIAISPDGQWCATSDDRSRTHIFNLDSVQYHTTLPTFLLPAQTLAFSPTQHDILILGFPDNTLQIYNVEQRVFPVWARNVCEGLPKRFLEAHDPILGVSFDIPSGDELAEDGSSKASGCALFWGSTWITKINLGGGGAEGQISQKKRRRDSSPSKKQLSSQLAPKPDGEQPREPRMITHYRPLLCVEFIAPGELVVVERPLVDVLATLPPAYFRHKYGKS